MHFSVFGLIQERHGKIWNDDTSLIQCQTEWYTTLLKKKAGSMIFKIEPEHIHGDRGDVSIFLASSEFSQYKSLWRFKMSRFRGCCESGCPRVRGVSWDGIPCVLFLLTHDGIQCLKSTILADLYFLRPIQKSKTKYLKEIRWPHLSNAYHVTLHDTLYPCSP